ncbi:Acyltransferase ChoActase/COT/CPT family-containing protein [Strongyloides ratti]|uniref:Acyltransferase ChoActase/COT/CPT family-containing protein n=1 Tax=Strongyloides ratti TaxID=34506 RepID=A0A090LBS6_STRRB|nr:Acyltransferase ChoActase/COT/CPT family-containing protein [Strongyloides ratti]CEF67201.1 Acyltransferase ChoActase/COT/CPT family-containing protein [Strongyloides ratti]
MSSNVDKKFKGPKPEYPLNASFPSKVERFFYKTKLSFKNNLYPVSPFVFISSSIGFGVYLDKNYSNIFNKTFTIFEEYCLLNYAKIGILSTIFTSTSVYLLRKFLKYTYFSYKGFLFEDPKKPSIKTKLFGIVRGIIKKLNPPGFNSCDYLLPNLPVPSVNESVDKYIESIKEIFPEDEFLKIESLAIEFKKSTTSKILQLSTKLYSLFQDNYVTNFWEQGAYLYGRDPLLINSSVGYVDIVKPVPANQARRAAHVVYLEGQSQLAIDREQPKPIGEGMFCMNHYKKNFCSCRVPGIEKDYLINNGPTNYCILIHKGAIYKINAFDEKTNVPEKIEVLYEKIVDILLKDENMDDDEKLVPAFTTDKRDSWAINRNKFFLSNENNKKNLEIIENSICVIYLCDRNDISNDDQSTEKFLLENLTGNGINRWVDKSVNYVVTKSGRFGGTTEHSIADGSEFDHFMENYIIADKYNMEYPKVIEDIYQRPIKRGKIPVERLYFEMSPEMKKEARRCYNEALDRATDVDLKSLILRDFGKGIIKKGKISPDGFIQMAIQLAYFKDQNKFDLTYEAASVRFYQNSRTETLRSVTKDSCNFVRGMLDNNKTKKEKYSLLKKATEVHTYNNKQCMVGKGFDRHLFVLYVLSQILNKKDEFLDTYIQQKWTLSTSQPPFVTNQVDEDNDTDAMWQGAAFGAVDKKGYGICYRFGGNHSLIIHITSYKSQKHTDSKRFSELLHESIKEMQDLFDL